MMIYRISRNIDSDLNLAIWRSCKGRQINLRHYRSIYIRSMGFSPYSNEIRQSPGAISEQTAKYNFPAYTVYSRHLTSDSWSGIAILLSPVICIALIY